jgi:hypothetical protein
VLLRPDNYIAFLAHEVSQSDVNEYFGGLIRRAADTTARR